MCMLGVFRDRMVEQLLFVCCLVAAVGALFSEFTSHVVAANLYLLYINRVFMHAQTTVYFNLSVTMAMVLNHHCHLHDISLEPTHFL